MAGLEGVITSRQNPTVKRICALNEKKNRYADRMFRFDGIKLFCEALSCGIEIDTVVLSEKILPVARQTVEAAVSEGRLDGGALLWVSDSVFSKISEERAPEGIITVAKMPSGRHVRLGAEEARAYSAERGERLLIAQSLRDAGNLGTVIRSCAALGIDRLVISDDCADIYNPKTIRAAMGGLFKLNIDLIPEGAMADAIRSLRAGGRRIYAAALHREAHIVGELELLGGDAFVIGNEGHGLPESTVNACDGCAIIPMVEGSESLNAAAAAAICIWETVRQGK